MPKGLFKEHKNTMLSLEDKPKKHDTVWSDQTTGIMYNFDVSRGKWLSARKDRFEFARKGSSDGMYIPLLGDLDSIDDVYTTERKATITSIYCRSRSGNSYKIFQIHKNGSSIYQFGYTGSKLVINTNLNIDILDTDTIQVYVSKTGGSVRNTVCRLGYSWRYDV